jgi:hypothetical protein
MTQPDDLPIVRSARRVLQTEANAILEMVEALPEDFAEVVELILKTEGRVIISGVGKSGHIGRKISATLGKHRHTLLFCPCRRGEPWRLGYDHIARHLPSHLKFRRNKRAAGYPFAHPPFQYPDDRDQF